MDISGGVTTCDGRSTKESFETIGFRRLFHGSDSALPGFFVFIVIQHDRRLLVHFNVTAHPTAEWTPRQIVEAFSAKLTGLTTKAAVIACVAIVQQQKPGTTDHGALICTCIQNHPEAIPDRAGPMIQCDCASPA